MMLRSIFLAALLLFSGVAPAKNLYVNNSGTPACSDSTTYSANDASNPWCTIARAAWGSTTYASPSTSQAAAAGDVVIITAGTYWEDGNTSGGRFTVSLNPANSGTSGNPITFRGVGSVYVRLNNNMRGAMIGCDARNYIVWDTLIIDDYYGGSVSDTGPVVFSGSADYCQIINSTIIGHPGDITTGTYYWGYAIFNGNYRGIAIEPATHIRVYNNTIYGFRGGANECGVLTYDAGYNTIENNTIYDSGCGIFIKGDHPTPYGDQIDNVIRKNLVYNTTDAGIRSLDAIGSLIYQNIIKNDNGPSACGLWSGFSAGNSGARFVNNTVYNYDRGFCPQDTALSDLGVYNNLIVNSSSAGIYDWSTGAGGPSEYDATWNRNLYYNNGSGSPGTVVWYSEGPSGTKNLAQFQSAGEEANGSSSNPNFVDAAAGDFHLQAGSPALTLGTDILDLDGDANTSETIPAGAYVTGSETIGASGGALLPGPTNIRFRPRASLWYWLMAGMIH